MSENNYPQFFDKKGNLKPTTFPGTGKRGDLNAIIKQSEYPDFDFKIDSTPVTKNPFSSDYPEEDDYTVTPSPYSNFYNKNKFIPVSFNGNTGKNINAELSKIDSNEINNENPYSRGGKYRRRKSIRRKSKKSKKRRKVSRRR
jgi:hypothetical protein